MPRHSLHRGISPLGDAAPMPAACRDTVIMRAVASAHCPHAGISVQARCAYVLWLLCRTPAFSHYRASVQQKQQLGQEFARGRTVIRGGPAALQRDDAGAHQRQRLAPAGYEPGACLVCLLACCGALLLIILVRCGKGARGCHSTEQDVRSWTMHVPLVLGRSLHTATADVRSKTIAGMPSCLGELSLMRVSTSRAAALRIPVEPICHLRFPICWSLSRCAVHALPGTLLTWHVCTGAKLLPSSTLPTTIVCIQTQMINQMVKCRLNDLSEDYPLPGCTRAHFWGRRGNPAAAAIRTYPCKRVLA